MPRPKLFSLKNRKKVPPTSDIPPQPQEQPEKQSQVQALSNDQTQPSRRSSHTPAFGLDCSQTVNKCVVTPDGRFAAVATDAIPQKQFSSHTVGKSNTNINHSATVYDLCSTNTLKFHSYALPPVAMYTCTSTALTDDATLCITGTQSNGAYVWDAITGKLASSLTHRAVVRDVDVSLLGNVAVTASSEGVVRVWDVEANKVTTSFRHHRRPVNACTFTASEKRVVSSALDCAVRVWDRRSGVQEFVYNSHRHHVTDVSAHTDGSIIASVGLDAHLIIWDVRNNKSPLVDRVLSHPAYCCAMTPDVTRIVVGGDCRMLHAYNLRTGSELDLKLGTDQNTPGGPERVRSCSITADGCAVLAAGAHSVLHLWKLDEPPFTMQGYDYVSRMDVGDTSSGLVIVPFNGRPPIRTEATQIECIFMDYMNHGKLMKMRDVARALIHDHELGRVAHIWQAYIAHVVLKTVLGKGKFFSSDDVGSSVQLDTFLFEKVYHKLCQLAPSRSEQQYVRELLKDAEKAKFISQEQRFMIIGDMLTVEHFDAKLERLETVMVQVYTQISSKLHILEDRVRSITTELKDLNIRIDETQRKMDRAAKIARYANLVKLGMALVPFAGTIAMAFVDETADLILSMDLHCITDFFLELFPALGQHRVDTLQFKEKADVLSSTSENEGIADPTVTDSVRRQSITDRVCSVKLVEILLSNELHERLSEENKRQLDVFTRSVFGGDRSHGQSIVLDIVKDSKHHISLALSVDDHNMIVQDDVGFDRMT